MERLGRPLTGPVRQARVWRLSCLLRAPTGDGDIWFKASTTSPLFVNEGVVRGALAGLFPGQVPAPLAVEPERGWMVLADFGEEVGWEAPLEVVEEVAHPFLDLATIRRALGALHQAVSYRSLATRRPPHGPVDRLVAPPGAGRPGVTDGTGGRCRTAQPGRSPPPQTAGRCTAERWGRWSWTRPRPRCRS
jgi:hypothetical protein